MHRFCTSALPYRHVVRTRSVRYSVIHRLPSRRLCLRPAGLTHADQRITEDVEKFAYSISELYGHTFKPLLDVVLFTRCGDAQRHALLCFLRRRFQQRDALATVTGL